MKKRNYIYILIVLALMLHSCTKGVIDRKPNQSQVVPATLTDFQALLDNTSVFGSDKIGAGEIGAGDFYVNYPDYQSAYITDQAAYNWQKDIWQGTLGVQEWDGPYQQVFYTNVVFDGLKSITANTGNQADYDNIKGMALFLRAEAFYDVAQLFAKPYDPSTAATDLGAPLRLTSDLNVKSVRSTVQQTYDQVTNDLVQASQLLPVTPVNVYRPGKAAAFALLARVYLAMGNYPLALQNSDASLKLYSTLIDYNTLTPSIRYPVPRLNPEVVYQAYIPRDGIWEREQGKIDSNLYRSYSTNDLRRSVFFLTNADSTVGFKGMYDGGRPLFSGMTTDEQYLIRAESYARAGQTTLAMADLNTLLKTRFVTGTFVPYSASSPDDALQQIITERRKELLLRGIRWQDLRRLNKDPKFAVTLTRVLNGVAYTLPPNDPRYVLPIPDYIILATGMQQNPR